MPHNANSQPLRDGRISIQPRDNVLLHLRRHLPHLRHLRHQLKARELAQQRCRRSLASPRWKSPCAKANTQSGIKLDIPPTLAI